LESAVASAATNTGLLSVMNHNYITEGLSRKANEAWVFSGTTRTVGSGGTYATITAAISAATSGDIIQILDGTYDMNSESGGYLYINDITKSLLIQGNLSNPNAVTLTQSNLAGSFLLRVGKCDKIKFKNIKIDTAMPRNTIRFYGTDKTVICFENCSIGNSSTFTGLTTISSTATTDFEFHLEIRNCIVTTNGTVGARPISLPAIPNSFATSTDLFITNSTIYGYITLGSSAIKTTLYDSAFLQIYEASAFVFSIGADTASPTNTTGLVDIRSCTFQYTVPDYGHCVMLGRGVKNAYFVNNNILIGKSVNTLAIGLVVKSTAISLGDIVIDGNFIQAPRPIYIKGGLKNYLRYNSSVSNWDVSTFGYGIEINNPANSDGPIQSTGNVLQDRFDKSYENETKTQALMKKALMDVAEEDKLAAQQAFDLYQSRLAERAKSGEKPFEFRKNDRDFQTGDLVNLREYDTKENMYSGDMVYGKITYVLREFPGLEPGYCVFGYTTQF